MTFFLRRGFASPFLCRRKTGGRGKGTCKAVKREENPEKAHMSPGQEAKWQIPDKNRASSGKKSGIHALMRKNRPILIGAIVVAGAISAGIIFSARDSNLRSSPVTINYVRNGSFTNTGTVRDGPTFWITNNTPRMQSIQLDVEVLNEPQWSRHTVLVRPLILPAYTGDFATIEFVLRQYPTNSWRLAGIASEQLQGPAAVFVGFRFWPRLVMARYRSGNKTFSLNPFQKGRVWYGRQTRISSPEVLGTTSIKGTRIAIP